jgi:hypothetical protein
VTRIDAGGVARWARDVRHRSAHAQHGSGSVGRGAPADRC